MGKDEFPLHIRPQWKMSNTHHVMITEKENPINKPSWEIEFFPVHRGGDRTRQLCELRRQIVKRPPDAYNYVLISLNGILVTD